MRQPFRGDPLQCRRRPYGERLGRHRFPSRPPPLACAHAANGALSYVREVVPVIPARLCARPVLVRYVAAADRPGAVCWRRMNRTPFTPAYLLRELWAYGTPAAPA